MNEKRCSILICDRERELEGKRLNESGLIRRELSSLTCWMKAARITGFVELGSCHRLGKSFAILVGEKMKFKNDGVFLNYATVFIQFVKILSVAMNGFRTFK